jgi:hypothetical protein
MTLVPPEPAWTPVSLLGEASKLERAYLVKCETGALGLAGALGAGTAGNLLPGPGSGSLGDRLGDAANAMGSGGQSSSAVRQYVTFAFNPTSYSLRAGAYWSESGVLDKTAGPPLPQFHHTTARLLELGELYLDATTSKDASIAGDVEFLVSLCSCNAVASELSSLLGRESSPPFVRFVWGTTVSFLSYVEEARIEYLMFRPNGAPIRAKVSVTLREMPSSLLPQNPTSGGRATHSSHVLVEGETLQSVATAATGDPTRWRDVAQANGIDDPFRVRPGDALLVPGRGA